MTSWKRQKHRLMTGSNGKSPVRSNPRYSGKRRGLEALALMSPFFLKTSARDQLSIFRPHLGWLINSFLNAPFLTFQKGRCFADILPTNCLASYSTRQYTQIRNAYRYQTKRDQMLFGRTRWHIRLLTFNQGVAGSRPARPTMLHNRQNSYPIGK